MTEPKIRIRKFNRKGLSAKEPQPKRGFGIGLFNRKGRKERKKEIGM